MENEKFNFKEMFLDSLEQDRFRLSGTKDENIDKDKVIDNTEKTYSRQDLALPNIDKNDKEIKTVKNSKRTQKQEKDYETNSTHRMTNLPCHS